MMREKIEAGDERGGKGDPGARPPARRLVVGVAPQCRRPSRPLPRKATVAVAAQDVEEHVREDSPMNPCAGSGWKRRCDHGSQEWRGRIFRYRKARRLILHAAPASR
jgi:hypothetical protein